MVYSPPITHRLRIRIRTSVRFSSVPFGCDPGATAALTEGRIGFSPFGGLEKLPIAPSSGTHAGLTLEAPHGTRCCL
jgi:hypothetical protein